MEQNRIPDFRRYMEEWSEELEVLRQNRLLGESAFIAFAKDRGLPVSGLVTGDPGDFHRRGWLASDGTDYDGGPLFHPFRIYPLSQILDKCVLRTATSASLQRDTALELLKWTLAHLPSSEQIGKAAHRGNNVVDLAILLEPVYWPRIVGRLSLGLGMSETRQRARLNECRQRTLRLLQDLDVRLWRDEHESLRVDAAWMDENVELYLLLRLASWHERERLRGHVSGALWIRHIAEVIRRGFEEVHGEQWPEEDQAFGTWPAGTRKKAFGSERPLDDVLRSKPYIAFAYGLFTGSAVRWYVEGDTEYYAFVEILPDPSRMGIEFVNLHGNIESGRDNVALKLEDWLKEDKALRRFSVISFDRDVPANVKAIRRQVELDNVVGSIAAHEPDFEFANFAVGELAEVAARMDGALGFDGDVVRDADWTGICSGRAFQRKYTTISTTRPPGLKGEEWGRALAKYAIEHPQRSDDGSERPLWQEIRAAMHGWNSNYDIQKERFMFDPKTFRQIARASGPTGRAG
jgi:hypothetical protein